MASLFFPVKVLLCRWLKGIIFLTRYFFKRLLLTLFLILQSFKNNFTFFSVQLKMLVFFMCFIVKLSIVAYFFMQEIVASHSRQQNLSLLGTRKYCTPHYWLNTLPSLFNVRFRFGAIIGVIHTNEI